MAYHLTRFGDVILPLIQPVTDMPTAPGKNGTVETLSTGFDAWGGGVAPSVFPYPLQYRVLIVGTTPTAYMTTINALRGMVRKRAYLYRTGQDGIAHRALARLDQVMATDSVETFNAVEVSFEFMLWSEWESNQPVAWVFDDGEYFDTGLFFDTVAHTTALTAGWQTITLALGGNVAIDDPVITVTAGSAPITIFSLYITALAIDFSWTGTLAAGKALVIDCGAWSVKNDGADAYSGLAFGSNHAREGLIYLEPGNNAVGVGITGGGTGSTINFDYADRWA